MYKQMQLYLVYDKKEKTVSTPLLAPTLQEAQNALNIINPENLNNLIIHPVCILTSPLDLFLLNIDTNINLPDFLTQTSDDNFIVEDTTEGRESSITI